MRICRNVKSIIALGVMAAAFAVKSHAAMIITDFNLQNPMFFAFPNTTWATPVNQFEAFTLGRISGQEVVSIGRGNPTVNGGAGASGLNLDLSGSTALQLNARVLLGNDATLIQILLFDADGTILRFSYPIGDFNRFSFSPAVMNFSSAVTFVDGSIPGFNLSDVTAYEVQGDFYDDGGTAPFRAQFDDLFALGTPEPGAGALAAIGLCLVCYFSWAARRRRPLSR
jgi:hypothetical protein